MPLWAKIGILVAFWGAAVLGYLFVGVFTAGALVLSSLIVATMLFKKPDEGSSTD